MSAVCSTPGLWGAGSWERARNKWRSQRVHPEQVLEAFQHQCAERMEMLYHVEVDSASYLYFFNTILFAQPSCSVLDALLDKAPHHHPQLLEELWVGVTCVADQCPQLVDTMAQRCSTWTKAGTEAPSEVLCTSISLKQCEAWSTIVDAYGGRFNIAKALGAALAVDCPQAVEWLARRVQSQPQLNVFRMTADVLALRRTLYGSQFDLWMELVGERVAGERQELLAIRGCIDFVLGSDQEHISLSSRPVEGDDQLARLLWRYDQCGTQLMCLMDGDMAWEAHFVSLLRQGHAAQAMIIYPFVTHWPCVYPQINDAMISSLERWPHAQSHLMQKHLHHHISLPGQRRRRLM